MKTNGFCSVHGFFSYYTEAPDECPRCPPRGMVHRVSCLACGVQMFAAEALRCDQCGCGPFCGECLEKHI